MKEAAAAVPAAKDRDSDGTAGHSERSGNCDADLISRLPDAILGTIISLLPTKDGARTQAIAHRWHHLWRSAPLNLEADTGLCVDDLERVSIVSRILSDHPGPARRFCFPFIHWIDDYDEVDSWFHSRALTNLQELDISFALETTCPLAPPVLRFASTLLVAKIGFCDFPKEITPSLNFPLLKQLTLRGVCISEEVFHGVLCGCHSLESLLIWGIRVVGRLRISSPTLRSIGLSGTSFDGGGLIIEVEDAPRLERLLPIHRRMDGETIRVIRAPKLQILGVLSAFISKLEIANLVFQGIIPVSLTNSICTVKVLALISGSMSEVLDVLRCFPCLEKLYLILGSDVENVRWYDPLDPIVCLETHLKKLVLMNYRGLGEDVEFANFFVLNAKMLKEIKFGVPKYYNTEWVADQRRMLQVENRASRDVQLEFLSDFANSDYNNHIHDLSVADPFDCWCNA